MSDTIPVQHESAVAVLRKMERDLDTEIHGISETLKLATARRDTLQDAIAELTRVPRARKPRTVTEAAPANDQPEDTSPRPTVFATPSLVEADAA